MPVLPHDNLSFCGLTWTFRLLPSKHTEISMWHTRPFASTF